MKAEKMGALGGFHIFVLIEFVSLFVSRFLIVYVSYCFPRFHPFSLISNKFIIQNQLIK